MIPYHLTADGVESLGTDIAIIPIGSTEQHGPHLPVSTDCLIAEAYATRIAEAIGAFCTPVLPISNCREHMGKKGSVWMKPETCYAMLSDIIDSLKTQGFRKIIIFQSHGGIFVIPPLIRQTNAMQNPDLMICKVEIMNIMADMQKLGILDTDVCMHADEFETSVIMYLRPDLVRRDLIVDCDPKIPREYLNYGSIFRFCPDGVWGIPSAATAEKGEALVREGVKSATLYIRGVFDLMETKGTFGYSAF